MSNKEQNRQSMHRKKENIASIYFDSKRGVTDVSTEVRASWAHARVYIQGIRPRCVKGELINQISRLLDSTVPFIALASRWSQSTNERRVWREKQCVRAFYASLEIRVNINTDAKIKESCLTGDAEPWTSLPPAHDLMTTSNVWTIRTLLSQCWT